MFGYHKLINWLIETGESDSDTDWVLDIDYTEAKLANIQRGG